MILWRTIPGTTPCLRSKALQCHIWRRQKSRHVISRVPGSCGQATDAVSAYTHVEMQDAPEHLRQSEEDCAKIWIRLLQAGRPHSWDSIDDPVSPLERNLYARPSAGFLWDRNWWDFLRCFSQHSLCTVSIVVTVSESTVVFTRFHTFQLQLCCTVTDKAAAGVFASRSSPCVLKTHQKFRESFDRRRMGKSLRDGTWLYLHRKIATILVCVCWRHEECRTNSEHVEDVGNIAK